MLTRRREAILKITIKEYIERATPVASETISHSYRLGVSPATIRNDMAYLEEEGYITRPHVSAGAIPLSKAYRYYVESLMEDIELPPLEQRSIWNLFQEVEREFEEWARLASTLLARLVQNVAVVTTPKAAQCRFKHLDLVALHEFLVLLVLIVYQTKLMRQCLSVTESFTQEELTAVANKLNNIYSGLNSSEILGKRLELSPLEKQVTRAVVNLMTMEDEREYDEPYLEGLRLMLNQPEFVRSERILNMVKLLEEKRWLRPMLSQGVDEGEVKVVIGDESHDELLQDLSLVFSRYGIPHEASGTVGVIGPTRMNYGRAIPTVRYLSRILSNLVAETYR